LFGDGPTSRREAQGLAANLLHPAIWRRLPEASAFEIESWEVRQAIAASGAEVRHQASWMLWQWMADESSKPQDRAERWRTLIGPFFRDIWPPDAACRDGQTSHNLVLVVLECDAAFPEAVDAVADVLVPHEIMSIGISMYVENRHEDLPKRFPKAFLKLLNAIIDPDHVRPPRDLAGALAACLSAEQSLEDSTPFRRLHAIARRFAA
jgi:hypothetical protein